jgi:hypothetical protein
LTCQGRKEEEEEEEEEEAEGDRRGKRSQKDRNNC